ncbi:MAG: GNAT family N-acetyltransferase [Burkholderiales bacterium]|nr:GNAT family N-acetyltransferase [Burkholderiales bacterium]
MFLKSLNPADVKDVALAVRLYCEDPSYSLQTFGRLPDTESSAEIIRACPVGCLPEDRLAFAAFDKADPVALLRVLRRWPEPEIATIGLLLVSPRDRRRHLGCQIVEQLSRKARNWAGIRRWRIVVLEVNQSALQFWRHLGFDVVREGQSKPDLKSTLTVMEREIKHRPFCQRPGHQPRQELAGKASWLSARLPRP